MSQPAPIMEQELQNELITANQLLQLISVELKQIMLFTNPGGDFETNIKQNAALIKSLADMQQINLNEIPEFVRKQSNMSMDVSQNDCLTHNSFRNEEMDDTQ